MGLLLATSLDVLLFEEQINFIETAITEHWTKLQAWLSHMPFLVEHWRHRQVTCDGCEAAPIKGPRFKCKSCDNYDLCGECFAKKHTINDGRCANHEFDCMIADFAGSSRPGMCPGMWGKGARGKGKGKCKGGCPLNFQTKDTPIKDNTRLRPDT